ncbi:MAG: hypothetical protein RMM28_09350 [Thermoleophilia bacterium]|nr:hypothetical protein [Gaiellaceae bacterium]MDW8339331.1 hypothetical protein [Thermoleophilia bacterium]
MDLPVGITEEERAWLESQLAISAWERQELPDAARLGEILTAYSAIPHPVVLGAQPITEHPPLLARFYAYEFLGPRRASAHAGWFLSGYLVRRPSGDVAIRDLAIEPEQETQIGITTDVLRAISPSQIVAKVRAYLDALPDLLALEGAEDAALADESREVARSTSTRRGRPSFSDPFFEQLARECLKDYAKNGPGVIPRIARRHNRPEETVRQWIRRATREGWLQPRQPGEPVWLPGPRLARAGRARAERRASGR